MSINSAGIIAALSRRSAAAVTVAGDFCLDKYLYIDGERDELSIETGLTAYQVTSRACYPGAAGTITNNLCSLGVRVACVGLIGEDGEGFELTRALDALGCDTRFITKSDKICTSTYVKPMYMDGQKTRELSRLDLRNFTPTPRELEDAFLDNLRRAAALTDAVIICDQFIERGCSAITDYVREGLAKIAAETPDKLFFADSRGFIDEFRGVTVKCNNIEAVRAFGYGRDDAEKRDTLVECGKRLVERNRRDAVITLGDKGALCFYRDGGEIVAREVPSFRVEGEIDICGAGDSFNAGYTLGNALGLTSPESALLANAVASITIRQIGVTGTATREQVIEVLKSR